EWDPRAAEDSDSEGPGAPCPYKIHSETTTPLTQPSPSRGEGNWDYFSGRMALWAALMSGSGNTPRIRTAMDATVSTATEAGDITTRTPWPGAPAVSPGSRMYMTITTRR